MTNLEYVAHITPILPLFHKFHMKIHEVIEDIVANKIVISATGSAETLAGPYRNDYIFVLSFNKRGDKVTKVVEFVDSKAALDFTAKIRELDHSSEHLRQTANVPLVV
jgi:ketosteroid isomerase-like protein